MQGKNRRPLGFNEYFEERGQHLLLPYESENSGCKQPGLVSPPGLFALTFRILG